MAEKKSVKRKVITAVVIVGVFVLLIGQVPILPTIRLQPLTADFLKSRSYRLMKTASRFMIS